jgi:hypothetical protein
MESYRHDVAFSLKQVQMFFTKFQLFVDVTLPGNTAFLTLYRILIFIDVQNGYKNACAKHLFVHLLLDQFIYWHVCYYVWSLVCVIEPAIIIFTRSNVFRVENQGNSLPICFELFPHPTRKLGFTVMYPNPREGLRRLVLLLILIAHTGS